MKSIIKSIGLGCLSTLLLASCIEEDERKVYPQSTPVIEEASIDPQSFIYGDSITLSAIVNDAKTPLSTLKIKMVVNDVLFAESEVRVPNNQAKIQHKFATQHLPLQTDNSEVDIFLTLINVEGDKTQGTIENVKGISRKYEKLYLVLDNGEVYPLNNTTEKPFVFEANDLDLKNNLRYRIAEKITADNQIDFSGDVWGSKQNHIQLVDEFGDYITTSNPMLLSTEGISFDTYSFTTTLQGLILEGLENLDISQFKSSANYDGENFKEGSFYLEKNKEIQLSNELQNTVFNPDYFERVSDSSIKYIAESGPTTLSYATDHDYVVVTQDKAEYPNVLFVCGVGIGYASKVKPEATTGWGFDNIRRFLYFRKIAADTYQGTIFLDGESVNFKPFENTGWGNEKKSTGFSMPDILKTDADLGKDDGNWYGAPDATPGVYKITINLESKVVTADKVNL
ncbi:hypothetical protein Bcop_1321 [Bacteroides coprosuis DSM 18011]|uniref:DUF5125 domain-containing protein n=1 Tax=Bacteroides coprosuis DSM 18011 TaxID=679937 RepID=F3ZNU4_9BACE|nr:MULTISPECIES: hypothetical protein [Bacteroides]EGJ71520.1 hypothetical protein Bcop_1321 [Bacteroides coprosuis DSM 18011]